MIKPCYGFVLCLAVSIAAPADQAHIVSVVFSKTGATSWSVDTTLRHADTGWEHYADGWRVLDAQGKELAMRVLYHPHVDEQPFTRSVTVSIPAQTTSVQVQARDKLHGWNEDRVHVDLGQAAGPRFTVVR
ncbi:MAG: hypothetical protein K0U93_17670 [Gammaproteobacteria bacterium]|nr:hypothetical protein [Gammaproteobacteria bacterium]